MSGTPIVKEAKCLFTTLGMIVLDELHFPAQNPKVDVVGGSGAYACLGARLFVPPPLSHLLGWSIRTGDDFPHKVKEYLQSWNILLLETRMAGQSSTRGELVYQDTTFGPKTFRYITEPLKTEAKDLLGTQLLSSRYVHVLASPNDTIDLIEELLKLRCSCGIKEPPVIIWDPAPPSCIPQNLAACLKAIELVDVFSPNHIELGALFDFDLSHDDQFNRRIIEELARKCLAHGIGSSKQGTVVVRAGREGCYVYYRKRQDFVWLPAFYPDSTKVIDPTGAGNAFLGGFAIGLLETGDDLMAACYGTVGATFALEQIGLPIHEPSPSLVADGIINGSESWNGAGVRGRLQEYTSRVGVVLDNYPIPLETSTSSLVHETP